MSPFYKVWVRYKYIYISPPLAQQPLVVQELLIIKATWSHWDTPQPVGVLWTSDQPNAETSLPNNTQHSQQTDIHDRGRIQTHSLNRRVAADPSQDHVAIGIHTHTQTYMYLIGLAVFFHHTTPPPPPQSSLHSRFQYSTHFVIFSMLCHALCACKQVWSVLNVFVNYLIYWKNMQTTVAIWMCIYLFLCNELFFGKCL